jgi:hypothetical protein
LRPALALGDPPLAFSDGAHWSQPRRRHTSCAPPIVLLGDPIPRPGGCGRRVGDTFPNRFRDSSVEFPGSHREFHFA